MIYVFRLLDKPDAAALRQRLRPEHKAYLGAVAERIAFAGPLTHDDGVTMIGSLLAIDFDSRDAAHAWLADEPFTRAGPVCRRRDPCLRQPVAAARRLCAPAMNMRAQSATPAHRASDLDGRRPIPPSRRGCRGPPTPRRQRPCASSATKACLRTMAPKAQRWNSRRGFMKAAAAGGAAAGSLGLFAGSAAAGDDDRTRDRNPTTAAAMAGAT